MRSLFAVPAVCLAFGLTAVAQQTDFSKVEVKAEKVAGAVYMLTGEGGNIGLSVATASSSFRRRTSFTWAKTS